MNGKRIEWIDVSKAQVIWLMVLGHIIGRDGLDGFIFNAIYSFHMPFFFFVSGFLHKTKSQNFITYTKANFLSLIIPYFFFRTVSFILLTPYFLFTKLNVSSYLNDVITGDATSPCGACWFLLCLFCVKELFFWLEKLPVSYKWLIVTLLALLSYFLPFRLFWNIDAAFMAIPFFFVGVQYKQIISAFLSQQRTKIDSILLIVPFFVLFLFLADMQGFVTLYETTFGKYPLLFYPCAFIGILVVLLLCCQLKSNYYIETYSKGTIIIMGLHGAIYPYLMLVYRVLLRPFLSAPLNLLCEIAISIIILLMLYYPIIWLQKYLPFFIGNRR